MPTLKETLWATLAITVASVLLVLGFMQLENTDWADGFRTQTTAQTAELEEGEAFAAEGEDDEARMSGVTGYIASFMKEGIFMGVPAFITLGVLRLTRRRKKNRRGVKAMPA